MASLQKFKLLATHCGTVTESPTRSPVIHLRRRKTLRMLFSGSSDQRRLQRRRGSAEIRSSGDESPDSDENNRGGAKREKIRSRRKLKELFMSSPDRESNGRAAAAEMYGLLPVTGDDNNVGGGDGFSARRIGLTGSLRPVSATFRSRFLRRAWHPVLVTIPEQ